MVYELGKSPLNLKSSATPIKMLIAQEMSKEEVPKKSQPSLIAKLMGLDDLPQNNQLGSTSCRSNPSISRSRSHSGSLDFIQKEHDVVNPYKDVFEIWRQIESCKAYGDSQQNDSKYKESKNEKNMDLIREKFMEAKRLSTDEKLRQSKQFQDAIKVLSSNKDLFLKFLQEPNSLFSQHHNLQYLPPRPDSKRITVLKPSKLVDGHLLPCSGKENGKRMKGTTWDKLRGNPTQLTQIVVLKPNSGKPHETRTISSSSSLKTSNDDGFYGDLEDSEPKESPSGIHEIPSGRRRDEALLSSVFSNGYIGDESSFSKSEVYYAAGNLSDSEVMSPTSRHSWDYTNRFGSPYSSSSFSRASYSPESSSVCREAKKRLSERWAMMSLNGSAQEQRHVRRNSSTCTLGEMLAFSDLKKSIELDGNSKNTSLSNTNKGHDADTSPKNHVMPNSPPGFLTEFSKGKKDDTKDLTMVKSHKSSLFNGNVSRLFVPRSSKSSKQKSQKSDDEAHQSSRNIGNDGSQCINDILVKDVDAGLVGQHLPEGSGNANENKDQPRPISNLELQLEDDDHISGCSPTAKPHQKGIYPNKYNLIDKSPPIGSITRTLAWDYIALGAVTPVLIDSHHVSSKTSTKPLSPEEEEQEWFLHVQTLLSAAGFSGDVFVWHSPKSPIDPSLRDKYMSLADKEPQPPPPVRLSKQRHQRSFQKLVFDSVNEALTSGTNKDMRVSTIDHVWGEVKEWMSGEERCVWDEDRDVGDEDEDGRGTATVVVQRVVWKEVVGQVWVEHLRLEVDDIQGEIEEKLVEQLVDEFVLELTGRVILTYTP